MLTDQDKKEIREIIQDELRRVLDDFVFDLNKKTTSKLGPWINYWSRP